MCMRVSGDVRLTDVICHSDYQSCLALLLLTGAVLLSGPILLIIKSYIILEPLSALTCAPLLRYLSEWHQMTF